MDILAELGTTEAAFNEAKGTAVSKAFEALPSGAYKATITEILLYTPMYNGVAGAPTMHYKVKLTDSEREVSFRKDVSATLQDGTANIGYANRLKSFAFAAGVDLKDLSTKDGAEMITFGKKYPAKQILGMTGKSIIALVRQEDDISRAEGESFKMSNNLEGVCATNGLDVAGDNAVELFAAKVEATPIFKFKPKDRAASAAAVTPASEETKAKLAGLI